MFNASEISFCEKLSNNPDFQDTRILIKWKNTGFILGKEDEEPENEPVAAVVPVDEGTVVDGVVSFEDKDVRDMSKEG